MPTLEIILGVPAELHDPLVAELADIGFESFCSDGNALRSYRRHTDDDSQRELDVRIREVLEHYRVTCQPEYAIHADRNWNARWEASVRAISVGRFVIAPDWDLPPKDAAGVTIRISPKMSFGTGHHESTRLALRLLEKVLRLNDIVLDAGTGTGILAIAAAKLGAAKVVAIDVDDAVRENFSENARANQVAESVTFISGSVRAAVGQKFDLIVANINRAVLLDSLYLFYEMLSRRGSLILSGLLRTDRHVMMKAASGAGFAKSEELEEGDWWSCVLRRRGDG